MSKNMNIMSLFFKEPNREFNVREVGRTLHITATTASKHLKELKKEKLLTHRKERNLHLYKSYLESDEYKDAKTYYTINKIRKSGLINELNKWYIKPTIILFGSAAKGLDTENSDIDLVIISENEKEFPKREEFQKKLGKEIQLFIVKKLKDLHNEHLINSVLNGIVIQGELTWT